MARLRLYMVWFWQIYRGTCDPRSYEIIFVCHKPFTSSNASLLGSYIGTVYAWRSHVPVKAVYIRVLPNIPRNMWHEAVLGYICVTQTRHRLACTVLSAIYNHGACMEVRCDCSGCTRLGFAQYTAEYVTRGCTRLHLCGQNAPPSCMHH